MGKSLRRRKRSSNKTLRRRKRSTNKTLRRKNIYKGGMIAAGGDNPQTVNFDQLEGKIEDYERDLGSDTYAKIKSRISTILNPQPKFACYKLACDTPRGKRRLDKAIKSRIKHCCEAHQAGSFSYYTDMYEKCTNCNGYKQVKFTEHGGDPDIRSEVVANTIEKYTRETDMKDFLDRINNNNAENKKLINTIRTQLGLLDSGRSKADLSDLQREKRESAAREAAAALAASLLREKELKAQLNVQVGTPNEPEEKKQKRVQQDTAFKEKQRKKEEKTQEVRARKLAKARAAQAPAAGSGRPPTAGHHNRGVSKKSNNKLIKAIKDGNKKKIKSLLNNGANPKDGDELGYTPLHHAVMSDNVDLNTIGLLLNKGADPNDIGKLGHTPLHLEGVDLDKISFLIDKGADPNIKDLHGDSPLHIALVQENVDLKKISLLLDKGADVNGSNSLGFTPLQIALIKENDSQVSILEVALLLNKSADINKKNNGGISPKDYVEGKLNAAKIEAELNPDREEEPSIGIFKAINGLFDEQRKVAILQAVARTHLAQKSYADMVRAKREAGAAKV